MFCSNCGTALEEGVKFCPNCGTPALGNLQKQEPMRAAAQQVPQQVPQPAPQQTPQQQAPRQVSQPVPQQVPRQIPQQRPVYDPAQAAYAPAVAAAPSEKKKVSRRWPVIVPVFCILALLIAAAGAWVFVTGNMTYMRQTVILYLLGGSITNYRLAMILEAAAIVFPFLFAMIVFFAKTKRKAWLTALPLTIYLIGFCVGRYFSMTTVHRTFLETELEILLYFAELFFATLLWWLLVTIRPRSKALAVIFLIVVLLLSLAVIAVKVIVLMYYLPFQGAIMYFLISSLLITCADLFLMIAYSIAGFSVRKKAELA